MAETNEADIALPEPSPPAGADEGRMARIDAEIAQIDSLLGEAHFHTVLALANATRELLDGLAANPLPDSRRARLEVITATAQVGLGRRSRALLSMQRALRADPSLALDELKTSPKVLALLTELRARPPAKGLP